MMIIIKLTQLRCVLIAQSSNVLIVIRKSILAIVQKNEFAKGKAPNYLKNLLGRSIVTATAGIGATMMLTAQFKIENS